MKTFILFNLGMCLCAAMVALADPMTPPGPEPGQWELTVTLSGAPAQAPAPSLVCLPANTLGKGAELAFIEAAVRSLPGPSSGEPKCTVKDLVRTAVQSNWQAQCKGPRGEMQGAGKATMSSHAVALEQTFAVDMPFGKRTLTQTIRGRRVGACA
jgi:hypothetical protein